MPNVRILAPSQCRGARGLLGWSQEDLADRAKVSRSTVKDFETERHGLQPGTERLLMDALEAGGVVLIAAGDAGPGVRLTRATPVSTPRTETE